MMRLDIEFAKLYSSPGPGASAFSLSLPETRRSLWEVVLGYYPEDGTVADFMAVPACFRPSRAAHGVQ